LLGRALIGAVFAILTPLSFGFPPQNEAGSGEPYNAWPYVAGSALVLFALLAMVFYRTQKIRNRN
jgi:hypothetical protein